MQIADECEMLLALMRSAISLYFFNDNQLFLKEFFKTGANFELLC